jgi:polyisoprenoid-binding protein YceI
MSRTTALAVALVAVVAVAIGGYLVYDNVLRGDAAAPLTLPSAVPSASNAAVDPTGSVDPTDAATADPAASASTGASTGTGSGDLAGDWTVASGSLAGYRVREQLANLPAESDAVGRTDQVTGTITLGGSGDAVQLTAADLSVDMTTLASDKSQRDNRLRNEGLQTDQFPTATFKLTQPVDVPANALTGTPSDVTLVGDLTVHGVTKSVSIPAQVQLSDGQIQVAGSLTFPLSDFSITAPNIGGFIVSIADTGTLEFAVNFAKG